MNRKAVGSVLMILGTSLGAGMLILPVVTAQENIAMSMGLLLFGWLLMTAGALSVLEVNLWLPSGTNMISMAQKTLGRFGKQFTWLIYLLLLYSLVSAYLSGLSDVTQALLSFIQIEIPRWSATLISLLLFGLIVHRGISSVDLVNRGLMSLKLLAYVIIIALVASKIHFSHFLGGDFQWRNSTFMVIFTSFGYAIIIPSLRGYLNSNQPILKRVVIWGSLLPLFIYAIWIIVIQGLLSRTGANGLVAMITSDHSTSLLMKGIAATVQKEWTADIAKLFISICAMTSFLGVSVCLTDFIADGLKDNRLGKSNLALYTISYLPPLLIVLLAPGIFIKALSYAGIICLILLVLLPLMMLYNGRYRLGLPNIMLLPLKKRGIQILIAIGLFLLLLNLL